MRDALDPTPLAEALLHRHHARSTAAASKRRNLRVRLPCRATRVRCALWRTGRSTKGARARWRTWRGCLCGQHAPRSTPRRWPRLFFTDTAPGRRLRLRNAVITAFNTVARDPRALRPVENQPTAHGARRRWRTWRGCLRSQRATRSISRRWPRLFFTDTTPGRRLRLQNVVSLRPTTVSRDPRALRPVENQPMTKGARARWRTWRGVFAANARRAPSHAVGRGSSSPTPRQVGGCGFETSLPQRPTPCRATRARFAPWRTSRPPTGARARWRTWRGCLRGQRAARSIPRRWPRLFFTDTAPGRRLRLRNVVASASESVSRDPRALRPVENRPIAHGSTRALADLAWLSLRPTRGALHPTPLAEALLHRHRARSAAAASERRDQRIRLAWRATRARFAPWRTSRPPTEHAGAGGLGVVVFAANARRAPPHAVGRGSSSPTPRQVGGCGFGTS